MRDVNALLSPESPLSTETAAPTGEDERPVGVLLCHGFTGSPTSMQPWAAYLQAAGFRTSVPLLPGHGTHWAELNQTPWRRWYARVDEELTRLLGECSTVFVAGLSMGGALALRLAERRGPEVGGVLLVNPAVRSSDLRLLALPVLKRLLPSLPGISNDIAKPGQDEGAYNRLPLRALASMRRMWRLVRADLPLVTQPVLLFRSRTDHVVDPSSARVIMQKISSVEATERVLHRSWHVATLDHDAETIFAESVDFIRRHAG